MRIIYIIAIIFTFFFDNSAVARQLMRPANEYSNFEYNRYRCPARTIYKPVNNGYAYTCEIADVKTYMISCVIGFLLLAIIPISIITKNEGKKFIKKMSLIFLEIFFLFLIMNYCYYMSLIN